MSTNLKNQTQSCLFVIFARGSSINEKKPFYFSFLLHFYEHGAFVDCAL